MAEHPESLLYGPEWVHDLRDVYGDNLEANPVLDLQVQVERPDGPLAVKHRRRGIACRYDAIYAYPDSPPGTWGTSRTKLTPRVVTTPWCGPPLRWR